MTDELDKFLTFKQLRELGIAFNQRYLLRAEAAGNFPPRIHLGARKIAWSLAEIRTWIDARRSSFIWFPQNSN